MSEPEEQQVDIGQLNYKLEEIERALSLQRAADPEFDVVYNQTHQEKLTAVSVTRALNEELERLKSENVQLSAKFCQLKIQMCEVVDAIESANKENEELERSLKQKNDEIEMITSEYEAYLIAKADQFRKSFRYYNEEEINKETEEQNKVNAELKERLKNKQRRVDELKTLLESIQPSVPANLLELAGKRELEEKLKKLKETKKALEEKVKNKKKKK